MRKLTISFNALTSLRGLDQLVQLRQLSAYCCGLSNFEDLSENKRLEKLHIQQNLIVDIPYCTRGFNKLRHLRLDRNQITCIEHLQGCTSLRELDISFNKLTSLEGIAGLQSLTQLKANNNKIKSLKPLRALPALVELHVDSNCLTNLDGIQNLPTLETLHASCNSINRLTIPQTYTHNGMLTNAASSSSSAGSSRPTASSSTSTASSSATKSQKPPESVSLGMSSLADIFLDSNLLTTVEGINALGVKLECIDLSNNKLSDTTCLISHLLLCSNLRELNIYGNSFTHSGIEKSGNSIRKELVKRLTESNEQSLLVIDGIRVDAITDKLHDKTDAGQPDSEGVLFKTWDSSDMSGNVYIDSGDDSDGEIASKANVESISEAQKPLSREEIEGIESVFTDLISRTKVILKNVISDFDKPAEKQLMVRRTGALKSLPETARTAATSASSVESSAYSPSSETLASSLMHPPSVIVQPHQAVISEGDGSPRSAQSYQIPTSPAKPTARPHSANESLRSPVPHSARSQEAQPLTSRLGVLDTRFHTRLVGSAKATLSSPIPIEAVQSGSGTAAAVRRNKYEIPEDAEKSKPASIDRDRMNIFKANTNFTDLNR